MNQLVPFEDAYRHKLEELAMQEGRLRRPSLPPRKPRTSARPERANEIADMVAEGLAACEIARLLGVTRTLVYYYVRAYQIPMPPGDVGTPGPKANRWRFERQRMVAQLRDIGYSNFDIANLIGTRRQTVAEDIWCNERYGVPTKEEARTGVRRRRKF